MPAASLPTLEQHLEARLLDLDRLHRTRPGLPTAMARAEAGERTLVTKVAFEGCCSIRRLALARLLALDIFHGLQQAFSENQQRR